MRIGLLAPRRKAVFGGAATIEREVFEGVIGNAERHAHTLVIFAQYSPPAEIRLSKQVEWVSIKAVGFRHLAASLRRVANLFCHRVLHIPSPFRHEHWIDGYLLTNRVDFFLNIIPEIFPTEVPYFIFVFDLLHRLYPFFPEGLQRGLWERREERTARMIRKASILSVGTQTGKEQVLKYYPVPDESIYILPLPTPRFALESYVRSPSGGTSLDPEYIFYPANFYAHKNHATLLHALAILRDRHHWRLNLVLSGKDWGNLPYVRRLIQRLGLEAQVTIAGFVSRDDLCKFYFDAFAMVFPSLLGPDNMPPLEAFGLGCPVIMSAIPGASEQSAGASLLFPPTDESALAATILRLKTESGLRAELIKRGKERAKRYTSEMLGDDLLSAVDKFEPLRRSWGKTDEYRTGVNWRRLIGG